MPITASTSIDELVAASRALNFWMPFFDPPRNSADPEDQEDVAGDRADDRGAGDVVETGVDRKHHDHDLGQVAKRWR